MRDTYQRELEMSGRGRVVGLILRLFVVAVVVLLASIAAGCEGGFTSTGRRTSQSQQGDMGEIDVRMGSANGTTTEDIEFDYADAVVDVQVTLEVQEGTFTLEFLGEDDKVTLALEAHGGEKVSGTGYLVTDSFGEGGYRVAAGAAKGVAYHISYRIR